LTSAYRDAFEVRTLPYNTVGRYRWAGLLVYIRFNRRHNILGIKLLQILTVWV